MDLESRVTSRCNLGPTVLPIHDMIQEFARMIGVVREPEVGKDERLKVFDRLLDVIIFPSFSLRHPY